LRNKQGNDKITWLLPQGSDFTFADKTGVAVEDPNAFDCQADGKLKFACTTKRPDFGVYKYAVNLESKTSRKADPLDPWIVNN